MGNLSNLYISQSFISLIHLGSNNTASVTPTELEDGLGNGIGVSVSTNKNLYVSGNVYATNLTGSVIDSSSFVTTASFNAYTQSTNNTIAGLVTTASFNTFSSSNYAVEVSQSQQISASFASSSAYSASLQISILAVSNSVSTSAGNTTALSASIYQTDATQSTNINSLTALTSSTVRNNQNNTYSAGTTQSFDYITAGTASITYLTTIYETSSIIYSSGSNILGDAMNDTQTLVGRTIMTGSSEVTGSLKVSSDISSSTISGIGNVTLFSASVNSRILAATGSTINTGSFVTNIYPTSTPLQFEYDLGNGGVNSVTLVPTVIDSASFATTGSNSFSGSQIITGSLIVDYNAAGSPQAQLVIDKNTHEVTLRKTQGAQPLLIENTTNSNVQITSTTYNTSYKVLVNNNEFYYDASGLLNQLQNTQINGKLVVTGEITASGNISSSGNIYGANITGSTIFTGSFVTTSSFNSYTASQDFKNTTFATTSSVSALSQSLYFTDTTQSVNIASNSSSIGVLQTNVNSLTSQTASYAISSSVKAVTDGLQNQINTLATTSSVNDLSSSIYQTDVTQSINISANSSSIGLLQTFSGSQYKNDSSSFDSRINAITGSGGNVSVQEEGTILGDATSFNFLGAGVTATFSAGTASITIPGGGGSIDTGSFATTGSNTFIGDQRISGSVSIINSANGEIDTLKILPYLSSSTFNGNRDLAVVARGAQYNGTTFNPAAPSPVNIIFGSTAPTITATSIVSGSNNIITNLRTANTNGAEIIANNSYISIFPSTRTPAYAPVTVGNSNINALVTVTNNSVGLSSSLALGSYAFGYGNAATIANSNIIAAATLNPNSSSVILSTVLNAGALTVNGNKVGPDFTFNTGSGFTISSTLNVGTTTLFDRASGSFNAGATTFSRNLYGGVITVTNPSSATASAVLQNTIAFGSNLIVTGSDNPAATGNGGSAFFGRYNDQTNMYSDSGKIVFAVGTGTSTSNRKTALSVDSSSVVIVSGSLSVTGSSTFNGNMILTGSLNGVNFNNGNITASGDISVGTAITASTLQLKGNNKVYFQTLTYGTSSFVPQIAIDGFKLYQNQGQAYAFNINLEAGQYNGISGSQFAMGLQTNGSGQSTFGGSNYFALISGSLSQSVVGGTEIKGGNVLVNSGGGLELVYNYAFAGFDQKVYMDKGLYISASGVPTALTLNTNNGTAMIATGSVKITGSLELNGSTITSLGAGAFYSNQTQTSTAGVSQSMTLNNSTINNQGIQVASSSQMTVTKSGTYNIQFSAQLLADTGADDVWIWLKKNGSNISNSSTRVTLANNEEIVAAWNWVETANANDYFEIVWQSANGDAVLLTESSAGNYPAIPSVIATVTQIN